MKRVDSLKDLIGQIRKSVTHKNLDHAVLQQHINDLKELGHDGYDEIKFPPLKDMSNLEVHIGDAPENLAEALLWKLGKWPAYKAFANNYTRKNAIVSSSGGVVFNAFAKHLQDKNSPIYDQHAIRALWVISSFSEAEQVRCRSLLFKKNGEWKAAGSGDDGSCYRIFTEHIQKVCEPRNLAHGVLDKLLMPLGQAIKKQSKNYEEFTSLLV